VLAREYDDVETKLLYLNLDFAELVGIDRYRDIANVIYLGDWMFRQAAFPDRPDNSTAYFRRYFPHRCRTRTGRRCSTTLAPALKKSTN
jgi:hypothetical protein